ncbi:MAG: hypothetical protein JWO37_1801 [Acidimicrobiales bacterium]|jgi:hypothetical protein|nr:hypothetical protein [Acidimicrobiales bacterium]
MTPTGYGRRRRRGRSVVASMLLLAGSLGISALPSAHADSPSLRVAGVMPAASGKPTDMIVDDQHSLGFTYEDQIGLVMYDLVRMRVAWRRDGFDGSTATHTISQFAIDPARQLLFFFGNTCNNQVTDARVKPASGILVYDYSTVLADGTRNVTYAGQIPLLCPTPVNLQPQGAFFYQPAEGGAAKLYLVGTDSTSAAKSSQTPPIVAQVEGGSANDGSPLLIEQISLSGATLTAIDDGGLSPTVKSIPAAQIDWTIDLRSAGCGRFPDQRAGAALPPLVQRLHDTSGDAILSYCFDPSAGYFTQPVGAQGYVVRIPIQPSGTTALMCPVPVGPTSAAPNPAASAPGSPLASPCGGQTDPTTGAMVNATVARFPALASPTIKDAPTPIVDKVTGNLMLVTADALSGNAVWVYDPHPGAHRFVGVVTGGVTDQPDGNVAMGIDAVRGRLYLLTSKGILVAPERGRPLPGGVIYPVLANTQNAPNFVQTAGQAGFEISQQVIAVAPAAHRLFVPIAGRGGWTVVQDDLPDPPDALPVDRDALTHQIDEAPGKTVASATGEAIASGAHMIVVGGVGRIVNPNDPFCDQNQLLVSLNQTFTAGQLAFERGQFNGSCAADVAASPGGREAFLASTMASSGSDTGSTASGAGLAFPSSEQATDSDLKNVGSCGSIALQNTPFAPASQAVDPACAGAKQGVAQSGAPVPDASQGTAGADGRGFPAPSSQCADFGTTPAADHQTGQQPAPLAQMMESQAACDAVKNASVASASAAGFALNVSSTPVLSVGHTSSAVSTQPGSVTIGGTSYPGQVTTAVATADGVRLGPFSIAEVVTTAVTVAHGRTGTAHTIFRRAWCGLTGPGIESSGCFDPADHRDVLDLISQALGRVTISVPDANHSPGDAVPHGEATPGGYQAVVTKDPGEAAADNAVNDDASHTVAGLQAVFYNDGSEGRSRTVVQLAGVHAESRYGITPLSDFGSIDTTPTTTAMVTIPTVTQPTTASKALVTPPPAARPSPPRSRTVHRAAVTGRRESGRAAPAVRVATQPLVAERTVPTSPGGTLRQVLGAPGEALRQAIEMLVTRPGEFALLFVMWSFLAGPAYLFARRRQFLRALSL